MGVRIGVCTLTLGGTDLGLTKGGCEVNYAPEYEDLEVDQYTGVLDSSLKSEKFSVKIPLADITMENLANAIPAGTLTESGGKKKLTIGAAPGFKLSTKAKQLVLHPVANGSDKSEDIIIHKGVIISETKLDYKKDGIQVVEADVMALVDTSKSSGNYLATIGDTTI